ncbi:hypothetical protein [Variovorax paradoxus]|uniref:hypothetical protein n=1 Tax=Variovorax paradoxus TaxID=34073 RepID=UPI0029C65651|nr:hypothetical protein RZE77_31310 [Variovorax paradoxus]
MGADQVSEIAPGVREALEAPDFCATFEVAGHADKWVQFHGVTLNAAYPRAEHPSAVLAALGGRLKEWAPGISLTVALPTDEARTIAKWIDRYFETVLGASDDYGVDVRLERVKTVGRASNDSSASGY